MENYEHTHAVMRAAQPADPADVGALLKKYRLRARLTQVELADLSTISLRTIRNLEAGRGQNPRPETVRLLTDGLRLGPRAIETLNAALGNGSRGAPLSAYVSKATTGVQFATDHLVGRQAELDSTLGTIRSSSARVITLTGFGGVGKSRLALGIAQAAKTRYSMDWLWVPASATTADGTAPGSPAGSAGGGSTAGDRFWRWAAEFVGGAEGAVDDLVALVAGQPFLLVLDDLRQYGPGLDTLLTDVLQRCPRLVVVETTRRAVEQANRVLMPVKPLAIENAAEAGGTRRGPDNGSALDLLLAHARMTCPDLGSTEQSDSFNVICDALDGLPRAIENAASWLALSSPDYVAEMTVSDPFVVGCGSSRADDGAPWAYDALTDAINCLPVSECTWLERLSARTEPWTLQEAETMVGKDSLEAVRSVYEYLALGLIRPIDGPEGTPRSFTVLNHVKSFLT